MDLVTQKQALLATLENEPEETKFKALSELTMDLKGNAVKLEDLSLTFQVGLAMFSCTRSFPDKGQQIFDTSAVSYFFPNLD